MTNVRVKLRSGRVIWGRVVLSDKPFLLVTIEVEETPFTVEYSRSAVERAIKEDGTLLV